MTKIYKVKVFSKTVDGGNLAGVVDNAESLSYDDMQNIATQIGAPETAFILPSTTADIKVRWFTPNTEVGICVHATIAALAVLHSQDKLKLDSNTITVKTKNAILLAKFQKDGIFVRVPNYNLIDQVIHNSEILPLLPLETSQLIGNPGIIEIFDDRELVIEVKNFDALRNLKPEMNRYTKLCKLLGITGISIFTQDTLNPNNQIHTREFAPLYGYLEDPIAGMPSGAIYKYLNSSKSLIIEQGHFCNTSGLVKVEQDNLNKIWVGGEYYIY